MEYLQNYAGSIDRLSLILVLILLTRVKHSLYGLSDALASS